MSYTMPQQHAELATLTPEARRALWSIFYHQIAHHPNAKSVATKEWEFVLRILNVIFFGKGPDEYDSCLATISAQYKPIFFEGDSDQIIRILQISMERIIEAKKFANRDCISLLGFLEYVARPKPRGNFVRLVDNTFKEFGMPYYMDMSSGKPMIVSISNPIEKDSIQRTFSVLPEHGYSRANDHFHEAIALRNKKDWKGCINESIQGLESVAVTIQKTSKPTLGSAIAAIQKDGIVHKTLCNAMNAIWGYTSATVRHGQPEKKAQMPDQTIPLNRKEADLILIICMKFSEFLAETYKEGPKKKKHLRL